MKHEANSQKEVVGLDGEKMSVEYETAVRVAVLHQHPLNTTQGAQQLNPTTLMEQNELFVSKCLEAKVDVAWSPENPLERCY